MAEHSLATKQVIDEEKCLKEAQERSKQCAISASIVQEVAEQVQQKAHKQIADVVTRCLKAVFGEEAYTFRIDFKQARGKTEAHLLFERNEQILEPLEESGGGVVDVTSFALRVAALLLSTPKKRRFLALDEPMRMLSREYVPRFRDLLEAISEEFDIQFLIVTHNPELAVGKVIEVE